MMMMHYALQNMSEDLCLKPESLTSEQISVLKTGTLHICQIARVRSWQTNASYATAGMDPSRPDQDLLKEVTRPLNHAVLRLNLA